MILSVNGRENRDVSIELLAHLLACEDDTQYCEIWLSEIDGPSICCLKNEGKCFLMYLRYEGDAGFTTRGELDEAGELEFTLSNGQVDYYPKSWTIPYASGKSALEYFWFTRGMDETLRWHEG